MFNEANVDNRLRYPIRGRVIVFTTSLKVEFLEESLEYSYPLYSSAGPYPSAKALSFMVELDGFLTFDAGSQVKITELSPYEKAFFDPSFFTVVSPADPFYSRIVRTGEYNNSISAGGDLSYFSIQFTQEGLADNYHYLKLKPGFHLTIQEAIALPELQPGQLFLGANGYTQFMRNE